MIKKPKAPVVNIEKIFEDRAKVNLEYWEKKKDAYPHHFFEEHSEEFFHPSLLYEAHRPKGPDPIYFLRCPVPSGIWWGFETAEDKAKFEALMENKK